MTSGQNDPHPTHNISPLTSPPLCLTYNFSESYREKIYWTIDTDTTLLCVISFWKWTLPGSDTPFNVKARGCDSVLKKRRKKKKEGPEATVVFSEGFKCGLLQMCFGTMFPWTSLMRHHRPFTSSFTSYNQSVVGQLYCVPGGWTFHHKGKMSPRVEARWLVTQTEASQRRHLDLSSLCIVFMLCYLILIRPSLGSLLSLSEGLVELIGAEKTLSIKCHPTQGGFSETWSS